MPSRPFKREIDDCEIRVQRFDGAQCFRRRFRLPADLHIGLRVEQVREAVANHRVIIHEQDVQARLLAAVAGLRRNEIDNAVLERFPLR